MSETPSNKMLHRPGWLIAAFIFGWFPLIFAFAYLDAPAINFMFGAGGSIWAFVPVGGDQK